MKIKSNLLLRYSAIIATSMLAASSGMADSILKTAGNFAVLGGTGVSNTGASVISNGNVGCNAGAVAGFPPGTITNGSIVAPGAATSQGELDLIKVKNGLMAMTPDTDLSASPDLGGKTLLPGVYHFNAAASQTTNLTLNGNGQNRAYWVFQITGALTTTASTQINLINPGSNGGSDYGIFWVCNSAINIGASCKTAGIYISGTNITTTGGGRALALAAVDFDTNIFDVLSGPANSDFSGGLIYDADDNIVPIVDDETQAPLSFSYTGRKRRVTDRSKLMIRGIASTSATAVQYRLNKNKWRSVPVLSNHTWSAKMRPLLIGNSRIKIRALDAAGARTAIQRLTIRRVLN